MLSAVVNPLRRLSIIRWLRKQNVDDVRLRIAVVKRKPTRLYMHHYSMSGQKHMVGTRQREPVFLDGIGGNRARMLEAFAIASAENVHRQRQLVAAHLGLRRNLIG